LHFSNFSFLIKKIPIKETTYRLPANVDGCKGYRELGGTQFTTHSERKSQLPRNGNHDYGTGITTTFFLETKKERESQPAQAVIGI